ncbi:hypothetical protein BU17DRAFT_65701 [Hysterangium stoloniferum]|nr:hypothetical protein BU17DRAFT_65701 [Hysterangium stoloniferum]
MPNPSPSEPFNPSIVTIMGFAGVLSCSFVVVLLIYIAGTALFSWWRGRKRLSGLGLFTSKQIAVFVTCLLVSDLVQSMSGITQRLRWSWEISAQPSGNHVFPSKYPSQIIRSLRSCIIAAHTFWGIALGKHWPRWVVWTTVVSGWLLVIVLTCLVPLAIHRPEKGPFYSIAGTWCFISSEYAVARLIIHYIPLLIAAMVLLIFYGLIFLVLRGKIGKARRARVESGLGVSADVVGRQRIQIAKRLLWYPVAYLTCILPIAITRLVGLCIDDVPESVWIFGMFFLFSLGTIDSIIYATTRKVVNLPLTSLTGTGTRPSSLSNDSNNASGAEKRRNWDAKGWEVDVLEIGRKKSDRRVERLGMGGGIQVTLESIQEVI